MMGHNQNYTGKIPGKKWINFFYLDEFFTEFYLDEITDFRLSSYGKNVGKTKHKNCSGSSQKE